jgi:hypothetical protein
MQYGINRSKVWPPSGTKLCGTQRNVQYYNFAIHKRTNLYGLKRSELWATSGTKLYGTQWNVLQICDSQADQALVGHKRYQTVWYTTKRITNLRPTSGPSKLWAASGTRLYGTQRNVLQICDPEADQPVRYKT